VDEHDYMDLSPETKAILRSLEDRDGAYSGFRVGFIITLLAIVGWGGLLVMLYLRYAR